MAQNAVEVIDRDGWRRSYPLGKAIVHIGSAVGNDVVLDATRGAGVAARHVQLIARAGGGGGYRLVNMGDTDILLADSERRITPRSFIDLNEGERVRLGDFTLVFSGSGTLAGAVGPAAGGLAGGTPIMASGSGNIGMSLSLTRTQLAPSQPLDGSILVRNLGEKAGAQFKLAVEGLDPEWYDIGPGPILFPGASKEVSLRLQHPGKPEPPAGEYRFVVRASAPSAYPGESASAMQLIHIVPFYSHKLKVTLPE
jgi:hypothetical protein